MARDARLSILTAQEVDELYRLPRFTEADPKKALAGSNLSGRVGFSPEKRQPPTT
jgi:hypothetical protein